MNDDQVFNVEQFKKLLYADKDIIGGLYRMQNSESFACVQNWDKEYFKKNGSFEFLNPDIIRKWRDKSDSDLMKVALYGIWLGTCKKMYLNHLSIHGLNHYGIPSSENSETNSEISDFSSEDVSWCKLVIENGFDIWIDTSVVVGHEKMTIL